MEPIFYSSEATPDINVSRAWSMLQSGSMEGLEWLYMEYAEEMFKVGMALVPDRDFVWDCVQDVFVDLWKYHQNLASTDQVRLYLYKSLSNKIKKEIKKHRKEGRIVEPREIDSVFAFESHEQAWIRDEQDNSRKNKVALALEKLPLRQREVIHYLFFDNFTYEECSKLLDINLRSVYTLAWKALRSLRKYASVLGFLAFFQFLSCI
jgi:RNA polymerase sigma factor (sigma-70 family)